MAHIPQACGALSIVGRDNVYLELTVITKLLRPLIVVGHVIEHPAILLESLNRLVAEIDNDN